MSAAREITVVAAVVVRDGRVLLTLRPAATHLAGHWEFPGGKVERGETPPEAVAREMREELGVTVAVDAPFAFNWLDYGEKQVLLLTYRARIVSGKPRPIGCADLGWFDGAQVGTLRLPPADGPILERLLPLLSGSDQKR